MKIKSAIIITMALCLGASLVQAAPFKAMNAEGRITEYEGSVSVSGRFERKQDSETLVWRGDRVCFFPDAADQIKLPVSKKADRFFCFSNHQSSVVKLGLPAEPPKGFCGMGATATVTISRYMMEVGTDVYDQAWLDKVEKAAALAPIKCK